MTTIQKALEKTRPRPLVASHPATRPDIQRLRHLRRALPPAFTVARPAPAADPIEPTLDSLLIPKMPSRRATEPACAASQTARTKRVAIAIS